MRAVPGAVGVLVASCLALLVVLAGPALAHEASTATPARVHQTPSSGTPSTTANLLLGTTAASTTPPTVPKKTGAAASKAASDNRRVWYVVGGLVGAAVLLTALTVWFWVRTRPSRLAAQVPSGRHAKPVAPSPVVTATHEPPPRRPKRSVAGLDHVGSDNDYAPHATAEVARIEPNVVRRSARPSRVARAEVIRSTRPADRA
ncbi:MAG: hypothetical protein JWN46_3943 [Acidimicrobiales bacterium]|nr:hypothetical protein [Acidimicrobiales bacterium]